MKPEMAVRSMVHRLGYRFRLHRRNLPGAPDLVLPRHRAVIFVNGCFWHWHPDPRCSIAGLPKSNLQYWQPKLTRTRIRDQENTRLLEADGWRVLTVWECQLRSPVDVLHGIRVFLGPDNAGIQKARARRTPLVAVPDRKFVSQESDLPYPSGIDSSTLRLLFDNLEQIPFVAESQAEYDGQAARSKRETTAIAVDHAIRSVTRSNWRGNRYKEAEVRRAIKKVLKEDALVDLVFRIVKTQSAY